MRATLLATCLLSTLAQTARSTPCVLTAPGGEPIRAVVRVPGHAGAIDLMGPVTATVTAAGSMVQVGDVRITRPLDLPATVTREVLRDDAAVQSLRPGVTLRNLVPKASGLSATVTEHDFTMHTSCREDATVSFNVTLTCDQLTLLRPTEPLPAEPSTPNKEATQAESINPTFLQSIANNLLLTTQQNGSGNALAIRQHGDARVHAELLEQRGPRQQIEITQDYVTLRGWVDASAMQSVPAPALVGGGCGCGVGNRQYSKIAQGTLRPGTILYASSSKSSSWGVISPATTAPIAITYETWSDATWVQLKTLPGVSLVPSCENGRLTANLDAYVRLADIQSQN